MSSQAMGRLRVVGGESGLKPPHSAEIEREVLSTCFIGPFSEMARTILSRCKPSDFYLERNQIFLSCVARILEDRPELNSLDPVLFSSELRLMGKYEAAGGLRAIGEMMDRAGTCSNLDHYIGLLLDLSVRRQVLEVCKYGEVRAFDETIEVRDLVTEHEKQIRRVAESRPAFVDLPSAKQIANTLLDRYVAPVQERRVKVVSGLRSFDHGNGHRPGFGELERGKLYLIQGKPGHGKTAFGLNNYGYNVADQGGRVYVWSLDMSAEALSQRIVARISGVPLFVQQRGAPWTEDGRDREGGMSPEDWDRVMMALDKLASLKFIFDDRSRSCDVAWERMRAIKKEEGAIDLFLQDYVQLVRAPAGSKLEGESLLAHSCRTMLEWSKKDFLDCPGIFFSQPDKLARKAGAPEQTLADSKGSGAPEEVVDAGWIVEEIEGGRQIRVGKDRNFGLMGVKYGPADIRFNGARMYFMDA